MIIDCISDLHGFYPKLAGGDLLIVAGDLTARDTQIEYDIFFDWLIDQKYKKKIFIAGNHDVLIYEQGDSFVFIQDIEYLQDSGTEFEGFKIWGSPWTAWFHGINPSCKAFTLTGEEKLAKKWALIPEDTDILITHSPAGVLDLSSNNQRCGSSSLCCMIKYIRPKLHVFGHLHECGGQMIEKYGGVICVNAAYLDENYEPVHNVMRVNLEVSGHQDKILPISQ